MSRFEREIEWLRELVASEVCYGVLKTGPYLNFDTGTDPFFKSNRSEADML